MTDRARTDAPRTNREDLEVERKRGLLHSARVAPLTRFVERFRAERPEAAVPYFDPTEAGTNARILLLLEAPGRQAALENGSGFVSSDNDDQTAENMWSLLIEAGIDRTNEVATWNVVPWYVGDGKKIRAVTSADLVEASRATNELLALLPELRVVVLLGKPAARAWSQMDVGLPAIESPHPSPLNVNTRPEARVEIREALVEAKRVADG
jgi:uracil-DNA glycosylase